MKISRLLLLLILTAIAAFAVLNWDTFITPAELSLGFTTAHMPLGLVMLGIVVMLTTLFLIFVVFLQTSVLLETRRQSREMAACRQLADKAEASRLNELRVALDAALSRQPGLNAEAKSDLLLRIEQLEGNLRKQIEETGNTLAAYIGELDDRLEKTRNPAGGE